MAHDTSNKRLGLVSPKDLESLIRDLEQIKPWRGLIKSSVGYAVFMTLAIAAVYSPSPAVSIGLAFFAGLVVTTLMVMTHDAIHRTLTGWAWYDELYPVAVSYPLLWPHETYREIHKIHHKMNGSDENDPERVQWTEEEYAKAGKFVQWYVRNQWVVDMFVLGGIGFIFATLARALPFARHVKSMRRALIIDAIGIVGINLFIYGICISQGLGLKYFLLYLLVERMVGALQQLRAHSEHYGRFGKAAHYFETQIFNCRNIRTNNLVSFFFNGLNFHSVHHAFVKIPFYNLGEAHRRIVAAYGDKCPVLEDDSYLEVAIRSIRRPLLIGETDPGSPVGQSRMKNASQRRG
jgi:fatty acid desaturase